MILVLLSFTNIVSDIDTDFDKHRHNKTNLSVSFPEQVFGQQYRTFKICELLLINLLPLALGCFFYLRILYVVNQAAQSMGRATQRNRNPSRVITASVVVLLTTTMIVWMVYILCSTIAYIINISKYVFVYLKLIIFVLYPIGDGLFVGTTKQKQNTSISNSFHVNKSRARISPVMEEGSDMDDLTHPALKGVMNITVTERDEDSSASTASPTESTTSFTAMPVNALLEQNMAAPTEMIFPSTSGDYEEEARPYEGTFMKTSSSLDDIENEQHKNKSSFGITRALAIFHRRGSDFSDYKSDHERMNKRMRHTFEKMRSHAFVQKTSDHAMTGKEKRASLQQPLLSPIETRTGRFTGSMFEALSESPELRHKSSYPITTKGGYSGLSEAQTSTRDQHDRTPVLEQVNKKDRRRSRWSRVLPLIRDQSPDSQERNDDNLFERNRRSEAEFVKPSSRRKVLVRQKSKNSCFDEYCPIKRVETISNMDYRSPGTKARSISCVNNVYMDARRSREMSGTKPKTRNKSVSFMSSFHLEDTNERYSVDRDPYINDRFGKNRKRTQSMEKTPSFDLAEIIRRKTSHWMLQKTTSRQECISKLQELNEYF